MARVPCDPLTKENYRYTVGGSQNSTYDLFTCLENANDAESDTKLGLTDRCTQGADAAKVSFTVSTP
jgi:hypothetical protein